MGARVSQRELLTLIITTLSLAKNKPHITLKVEGFKQRARGGGTVLAPNPPKMKYHGQLSNCQSYSSRWRLSLRFFCIFIKSHLSSKFLCEVHFGQRTP